jgi:hypothetical protein
VKTRSIVTLHFVITILLLIFSTQSLFAQASQVYHSVGILLDDGAGNTLTLLPPASGGSNGSMNVFTPAYFNAYVTSAPTSIVPGGDIPITTVATISGFVANGLGGFIVSMPGIYNVEFTVARNEPSAFAVAVNGAIQPNAVFGCATGTVVVHGSAMIPLLAGQVIKLVSSPLNATSVTLESEVAGAVQASLSATRIQ